ncbi:hypothetical protein ACFLT9_03610 [Acidobacteriota bacterium]
MNDRMVKRICPLIFLLLANFNLVLAAAHKTEVKESAQTQEILKLYPFAYNQCPDIPSPGVMRDGTEIVVVQTKDKKFSLIPVTVKKGESLGYREGDWDKIRILEVDAEDFPTLARTGLHSEIELDSTKWITGRSIAEITESGRPDGSSGSGFMGRGEDIISVLKGDNRLAKKLGLTHPQLAKPLFHIWNIIRLVNYQNRHARRSIDSIDYILYNQRKIRLLNTEGRGWQKSIFDDEILGMYHIEFCIELEEREKTFIQEKYPDLSDEQMTGFLKRLSQIHTGEMVPFYIMRYGFYEGHSGYRADPIAISLIFNLRGLEDIEKAFDGNLLQVLTEHFTRGNTPEGEGR